MVENRFRKLFDGIVGEVAAIGALFLSSFQTMNRRLHISLEKEDLLTLVEAPLVKLIALEQRNEILHRNLDEKIEILYQWREK